MAKHKHMTEREFNKLKALLDVGVGASKVGKLFDRGAVVMWQIKKSKTFDEYKDLCNKARERRYGTKPKDNPNKTSLLDSLIQIETILKQVREEFEKTVQHTL